MTLNLTTMRSPAAVDGRDGVKSITPSGKEHVNGHQLQENHWPFNP